MKKSILMTALAFFALAGCTKPDQATPNEPSQDAPRVILNLTVAPMDAFGTKATKQGWDEHDYLYLFFAPEGTDSYSDLKNVVVKYNPGTAEWEIENTDTASESALNEINKSGKVLAIYTSGARRTIETDEVNSLFHLGNATDNIEKAYSLSMSKVTNYAYSAGDPSEVGVGLNLTRVGVTQITVTGITNDEENQWVLYNCGEGAAVFSGIGQLSAKFEEGAFTESALLTPMDEVPGINNGSGGVSFYVASIDDTNKSVRLILYNTKTEKSYVRILEPEKKVAHGMAYTIAGPEPETKAGATVASDWHQGYLIEYTGDGTWAAPTSYFEASEEVAKGYNFSNKHGFVIFKSGCPAGAFNYMNITSATIQKGVTTIGMRAFKLCTNLANIYLPSGLNSIGEYAFCNCSKLTGITLPAGITTIGKGAFSSCGALTTIDLPIGLTTINDSVFSSCTNLTGITLPAGVTTIVQYAFYNCKALTTIDLPSALSSIGYQAFGDCKLLETVICRPTEPPYLGGTVFAGNHANLQIKVPAGSVSTYQSATGWKDLTIVAIE